MEDGFLSGLHAGGLLRSHMVISAQVKHAVGDEKGKFAADAVAVFGCLFPDAGRVQYLSEHSFGG